MNFWIFAVILLAVPAIIMSWPFLAGSAKERVFGLILLVTMPLAGIVLYQNIGTPAAINFMAKNGRGLICLTLTEQRCQQLGLNLMARSNGSSFGTAFTVSIEAAEGVTTGISAADRARTVQAAVRADAQPEDLVQPGHIFPLLARPGGVLQRAGHTEAGCDLAAMAGCTPASMICEIMNEDGTMARRPELEVFAKKHNLRIGTIADLIEYRALHEQSVRCSGEFPIDTQWGKFTLTTFEDLVDGQIQYALHQGDLTGPDLPVRIQPINTLRDVLGTKLPQGSQGWSYESAMAFIAEQGRGLVVMLGGWESPEAIMRNIAELAGQAEVEAPPRNYRVIGTGAQILRHLGVTNMAVMSAPIKFNAISGFQLEVSGFIPRPPQ